MAFVYPRVISWQPSLWHEYACLTYAMSFSPVLLESSFDGKNVAGLAETYGLQSNIDFNQVSYIINSIAVPGPVDQFLTTSNTSSYHLP
jgi:hypothetical protein